MNRTRTRSELKTKPIREQKTRRNGPDRGLLRLLLPIVVHGARSLAAKHRSANIRGSYRLRDPALLWIRGTVPLTARYISIRSATSGRTECLTNMLHNSRMTPLTVPSWILTSVPPRSLIDLRMRCGTESQTNQECRPGFMLAQLTASPSSKAC